LYVRRWHKKAYFIPNILSLSPVQRSLSVTQFLPTNTNCNIHILHDAYTPSTEMFLAKRVFFTEIDVPFKSKPLRGFEYKAPEQI
jgi:hypothetical protein